MHQNSILIFEKYAQKYFKSGMRVLEIGPGGLPSEYQSCVANKSIIWHTLNIKEDSQFTYSGVSEYNYPIPDNTYDIVLSGQVLEHVRKIWIWIKELSRVCKVDGYVITINPVSWHYHDAPVDCWRVYPEGMKALYGEGGLEVIMSQFETIEGKTIRRPIPGIGIDSQSRRKRLVYRILGLFGFPVECCYDTITIGQKLTVPNSKSLF